MLLLSPVLFPIELFKPALDLLVVCAAVIAGAADDLRFRFLFVATRESSTLLNLYLSNNNFLKQDLGSIFVCL